MDQTIQEIPNITFKPLANNKVRCNQTGEIIKANQTKSYRRKKMNEQLRKLFPISTISSIIVRLRRCGNQNNFKSDQNHKKSATHISLISWKSCLDFGGNLTLP